MSEDKARAFQEEIISLNQNNFVANMSASSSTAEADLVANEAKTMLNEFVNANQVLNDLLKLVIKENIDLKASVTSLSKALATAGEALKAEQKTHHKE